MILGIDFDNTIVSYDTLFHRVASEKQWIPATVAVNKTAVRDYLRQIGKEEDWTWMQGEVYGAKMQEAEAFPGVKRFFQECKQRKIKLHIISHKTRTPFLGAQYDLHAAATGWLEAQGFFAECGMEKNDVFFEVTKAEKIQRILDCQCDWFIDDLPEILAQTVLIGRVNRLLFDPAATHPSGDFERHFQSWAEISQWLFEAESCQ